MRGIFILLALLLGAALLSLMVGQIMLGPADLWTGLLTGMGPAALTLRVLRGPGLATAIGAGAVLGTSGAIFQLLLRNPLAAPDVMGFTSGAGLAVLVGTALGLTVPMPLLAAAGGLAAAGLVALLSYQRDGRQVTMTFVLVGIGVAFFTSAASGFLMTRLSSQQAMEAQRWLTGSLSARDWGHVAQVFSMGAVLALLLAPQVRGLALLELGDDLAAGLGLRVRRARRMLALTAVLFAAAGVAVAGPVPFVALMAGPLGGRLINARQAGLRLAAASVTGAILTVLADLAGRTIVPGLQLPVGVMTGIFGAPYLLWLLSREMETGDL
ncbi:FecCD family ABC transporter permease [Rhizobium halophytocola]|uniref:Iron complex transport system permease protein n=1 Tax=Rhizobium halophytocola TaxID=735519 RepID=A0ABS4E237_9HYPH|nr:iron ABC transporter permease [Rhizobium halophytocola]MBP1852012.1 iron complex transport system permease protein [Rhizobium halophytocola]